MYTYKQQPLLDITNKMKRVENPFFFSSFCASKIKALQELNRNLKREHENTYTKQAYKQIA